MVSHSGRRRKRKREDSFNCVRGSASIKEVQGDKDFNQMDQSVELSAKPNEVQGEKYLNQMDHSVKSSARLNKVQGEKDLNQTDQSVESLDRISRLPDHVIHNMLSHLRNMKDAIRTSILSKRWRSLWYSFSVLIFDERRLAAGIGHEDSSYKRKMFRDYVSNTLQTHLEKNLNMQKLVLHMTFDFDAAPHVDQWLSVARAKNIKELDLHFGIKDNRRYTVPQAVFSSQTLTGLRLSTCQLETCDSIMLPHLQKLYLRKIHLVEPIVQNLISSCQSIEDLRFIQCSGLKHLQVSNLFRLNRVEIHHCNQLRKVDLCAPNLHTFWYCGKRATPSKVNLEGCKSLRRMTLEHPQVARDFLEEQQISNFPLLEKLDLCVSNKMKCAMISHPQLQRIVLKGCHKLACILINAPNLLSFEYMGVGMPYIEIYPFCITDAKLSYEPKVKCQDILHGDKFWLVAREFIKKFDPNGFKLVLHSNKNIVIHEDLNNISLPPLPGLGFEIIKSSACIEDILSGLLRTLRPASLSIISSPGSNLPQLVHEMIKNKDEDPNCCKYNTLGNKCWRHFLKDVKFEDLCDIEVEADEDKGTSATCIWYTWLKSSYAAVHCQIANARFYWDAHRHDAETQKIS